MSFLLGFLLSTAMAASTESGNCDQQARNFAYKNGCIVDADAVQCMLSSSNVSFATSAGSGFAAGRGLVSGAYATAAIKGLVGDAKFVKDFEKNLARLEELNSMERIKDRVRLVANHPVTSAKSSDRKMIELAKEFLDETRIETPKAVNEVKEGFAKDGSLDERLKVVEDKIELERKKIFKNLFPDDPEFKKIHASYEEAVEKRTADLEKKDFIQEKNRLYAQMKKAQEGKTSEEQEKIRQKMQPEFDKIEVARKANTQALADVRKSVAEQFMGRNPKLSVLLRIQELTRNDFHIGKARLAMSEAKPGFENKRAANLKNAKVGVAGAGLATMVSVGLYARGQVDIRRCQKTLGLSDEDVKFLGNGNLLAPTKATRVGFSCDSMVLEEASKTIEEAISQYGSLSPGLCNIIKLQDQKLDALIGDQTVAPVVSCDGYKDTNVQVTSDKTYQYNDGDLVYKAPYSEELLYPDFRFVKVYGKDGNEKKTISLDMQGKYSRVHPANVTNPRPDVEDLATMCRPGDRGFSCPLVQGAVRARIAKSISKIACGTSADGKAPNTVATPSYPSDEAEGRR